MTRHRPHPTSDSAPAKRTRPLRATVGAVLAIAVASTLLAGAPAPEVTPASGPSWLTVLGAPFERTSLGRLGVLGNERSDLPSAAPDLATALHSGFTVGGEDLYRYNCRSCHGARGAGLPPQVRPLTWAIKATSPTLQHRLAADDEAASQAAGRAEEAVRYRISRGGTAMPAFEHFSPDEIEALFSYLEQLAEVPDPQHESATLERSLLRVGEHVVKGTCQTCHQATGEDRRSDRPIPALSELPRRYPLTGVMAMSRHAVEGSTIRPRGPSMVYFRPSELAAAYVYLSAFPPTD